MLKEFKGYYKLGSFVIIITIKDSVAPWPINMASLKTSSYSGCHKTTNYCGCSTVNAMTIIINVIKYVIITTVKYDAKID
jgi:hypothetical protein